MPYIALVPLFPVRSSAPLPSLPVGLDTPFFQQGPYVAVRHEPGPAILWCRHHRLLDRILVSNPSAFSVPSGELRDATRALSNFPFLIDTGVFPLCRGLGHLFSTKPDFKTMLTFFKSS